MVLHDITWMTLLDAKMDILHGYKLWITMDMPGYPLDDFVG
jgi:hypothetical protein